MSKLSVIIPSLRDRNLDKTINDILYKSKGDIEIIVFLDMFADKFQNIITDKRVKYLKSKKNTGMRTAINMAVQESTGKYLMKCDSHCSFIDGFDIILKKSCDKKCISVPTRYNLDQETWKRYGNEINYIFLKFPTFKTAKEFGFRPRLWRGKHGLIGKFSDINTERRNIIIDEIVTFQGSCWFTHRSWFDKIGGLDVNTFGNFGMEGKELSFKSWLCGGRVLRDKNAWYAHVPKRRHKLKSIRIEYIRNINLVFKKTILGEWDGQTRDLRWFVNRLGPFDGWPDDFDTIEYINYLKKNKYI